MPLQQRHKAYALAGIVLVLWGIVFPASKVALAELDPWLFRAVTLVIATLLLHGLLVAMKAWSIWEKGEGWGIVLCAIFNVVLWHMLSAYGISLTTASKSVMAAYTMPIWSAALAIVFLGERPTVRDGCAILLGGIAIWTLLPSFDALSGDAGGIIVATMAAWAWACGTVIYKSHSWRTKTLVVVTWQTTLGAVPILIGALVFSDSTQLLHASSKALLASVGVGAIIAISFVLWFYALSALPAIVTVSSLSAVPVLGTLFSVIFLGEAIGGNELLALVMILGASVIVYVLPLVDTGRWGGLRGKE